MYYFRAHKLSLHPAKTKFIIFTHSKAVNVIGLKINIDFNNYSWEPAQALISPIEFVNMSANPVIKFLGFFYPTLSFKSHITTISSKICKSLFVLRSAGRVGGWFPTKLLAIAPTLATSNGDGSG
jgi:hypothetical protein